MPILAESSPRVAGARNAGFNRTPSPAAVARLLVSFPLRDYQRDAVQAALAHLPDRSRIHLTELPAGAGKTMVGVALAACLLAEGYRLLWLCKRWDLLRQATDTVQGLLPHHRPELRRLGGAGLALAELPENPDGRICFTTLQTWYARRRALPVGIRPAPGLAIIWDEAHWAVGSALGQAFRRRYLGLAAIYGLSATPVVTDQLHIAYHKAPEELWGTVLARPEIKEIQTETAWSPELLHEDYSPRSLGELGRNAGRNQRIVCELLEGRRTGRYRRTLLFACNIAHALDLHRLLSQRGIPARVVHCRQGRLDQEEAIRHFRQGQIDVLVNVEMLTEGLDLPEIDTVFLARPTRSRRLLTQMVGRGARQAAGKDFFWAVDFVDCLASFDNQAMRARTLLPERLTRPTQRTYRPVDRHQEPTDVPQFANLTIPDYGTVPIALGQTVGVEIELTASAGIPDRGRQWDATAQRIIGCLQQFATAPVHAQALDYEESFPTQWHVKDDRSAGWEIVSPVLQNAEGFEELRRVCDGLTALVADAPGQLRVNHRTGLHITLATRLNTNNRLRGFLKRVQRLEPGLFTLTSPSRLYAFRERARDYSKREGNGYCLPLRRLGDVDRLYLDDFVANRRNRYYTVNLTRSKEAVHLLEVRMHGGTSEFCKIALWLSLWMQIFNRSRYCWRGGGQSGPVLPLRNRRLRPECLAQEDIIALLAAENIPLTAEFTRLLQARRRALRHRWQQVLPRRVAAWEAAGWYADG